MNVGKTPFAQVMEYVSWKTLDRIINSYGGDADVRTLSCTDLFRVIASAQLTWRESLRDIEVCRSANQTKLFHMGIILFRFQRYRYYPFESGKTLHPCGV
jgi:Domain of unknown function (DUF4372)